VRVDAERCPFWAVQQLQKSGARISFADDPCLLPKSIKNAAELDAIRAAHRDDGVALTRFLAWLAETAPLGGLSEIKAADRLEMFRRDNPSYRGASFPTISAAGASGAIVHYRAREASNRRLEAGSVYLVDSGGQYPAATTDVTRTIAIGDPPDEARTRFTQVLQGHIALATAIFPQGTTGGQLDVLARLPLWRDGVDYDHGTGHGVGAFLCVHEGPQRISKLPNNVALMPGMILSNEPGYYKPGQFGIRIENLVAVVSADAPQGAEQALRRFETLTLAPIDRGLIDPRRLSAGEREWLDAYHQRVYSELSPLLDDATVTWLANVTRPLE
jgi:Xaa-Pro aminopeptidase